MKINKDTIIKSHLINQTNNSNNPYKNEYTAPKSQTKGDSIEISSNAREIRGLGIDKGTAAHTTLYVDYSTFRQISNFTTNNPECQWEEMGIDGEKRWIVVNGQRFESPLSEEEKKASKRSEYTLLDALEEAEKQKEKYKKNNEEEKIKVNLTFSDGTVSADSPLNNTKINNLLNNEKVMDMLQSISKLNGGKISLLTTN